MLSQVRKRQFSMIEVVLALIVVVIGIIGVISLLPVGIESNQKAVAALGAGDAADQFMMFIKTEARKDPAVLDAFPASKPTTDGDDRDLMWSSQSLLLGSDLIVNFAAANQNDEFDPSNPSHQTGFFFLEQTTDNQAVDYSAILRVWKDVTTMGASMTVGETDKAAELVVLHLEISSPATVPYDQRTVTVFKTEIFLPANVSIPVNTNVGCGKLGGKININPNNSPDNEFQLIKPDGTQISRDDLHAASTTDDTGMYYVGSANEFWVKPKGNGTQADFTVDGSPYTLENKNLYHIYGEFMKVKIYNDKLVKGKAMGHWWIEVSSPCGGIEVAALGSSGSGKN